jgi:cytochrome P450
MLLLMDRPEQLRALQADPDLIDPAVEELLRVDSSGAMTSLRYVVEDLEFGGVGMCAGDVVAVLLAAANQDPRRFPRTDRIDLHGTDPAHIAFGAGAHFCLGAPLARLEAQVALRGLLTRFTDFALAVPRSELAYKQTLFIRGLVHLPVTYRARS